MKKIFLLIILGALLFSLGCQKKLEAEGEFPEIIPGKIVFSTSRENSPYNMALYEKGKIRILREGGLEPKFSPSGKKIVLDGPEGVYIFELEKNSLEIIPPPNEIVDPWLERWLENETKVIVIGKKRLEATGGKIPSDLWIYDLNTKKWSQITHFKLNEGIFSFDTFADGKRIMCGYSADWTGKERGTYVRDLATGQMERITDWVGNYKILPDQKSFIAERAVRKGEKLISYSEIIHFDLETKKERILTNDGLPKSEPTVSPDGKWALYSADVEIGQRIFMLNISTGQKKEIFDRPSGFSGTPANDRNPDWFVTIEELNSL